jgi:hypothetical protein
MCTSPGDGLAVFKPAAQVGRQGHGQGALDG